jgi:hypothetical protein
MKSKLPEEYFYKLSELRSAGVLLSRSRTSRLQAIGQFPRAWTRPGDCGYFLRCEVDEWVRQRRALLQEVALRDGSEPEQEQQAA